MVSLNELKNKDVVIFGTGLEAVRCAYYLNKQGISIKYFLNNDKKIDFFYGKPVYLPVRKQADNVYILIAVREIKTYLNISKQLSDLKFREFKDYLFYKWIDRKLVLLHGNCHMTIIKSFLESSQNFLNKYAIYPNALIYENKDKMIDERVLKNCDVWV
ncbi:MAG: hypothetical protein K2N46_02260, partial [Lachnospiraceae bacterium]|nr:hypothetical protein [Lachnospiraceae bacterium]